MGTPLEMTVEQAYRRCARMQLHRDPTYWWAVQMLPADRRPGLHALYGYVRGADDIADARVACADRRAALDAWQRELEDGLAAGRSSHPVIAALVDAGPRYGLALGRLGRYMDSMRSDCEELVRMRSQEELDRYMEGTAGVGPVVTPLLDAPPSAEQRLQRLGVAFQLANLIRDVRLDWELGRIYLPGLNEEDLERGVATARMREHVAGQVARARELFADAEPLAVTLPSRVRRGVRIAVTVYSGVLDRIERHGCDVLTSPTGPGAWAIARASAEALRR
ncbi:MAG: phytoene/squalene synthase family protein [Actinobacteria bacterium]|nr:phytoene/squalene synthase family protein [Actinomycetota bacterium]